ncbi:MAG: (2Fe-2S)-binding protein, partial [Rhodospirillaceae bacterium]|nr:(2Fe-2S)-binding protein [Rhodospirillaceae bacterium]
MPGPVMRLAEGGRIDRARPLEFTFNGRALRGYPGDTLASALLANGVHLVGRSFKYHRPRGILSAGAEEPNALVQLGTGAARTDPNQRATQVELYDGLVAASQNAWPSVRTDLSALNDVLSPLMPAGFYYKTFMGPSWAWMQYEKVIRRAAGLGRSPSEADPDIYDQRWAHCDVLVIGGGAAGLSAALAAGRTGARVMVVDEQSELGGGLLTEPATSQIDGKPAADYLAGMLEQLAAMEEVTLLPRTTAFGYYAQNFVGLLERVADHVPPGERSHGLVRERLWKVRAREVVLATGAIERHLAFPDNDRPGIMLAGSVRSYLNRFAVKAGDRVALFTNNDSAYATAVDLVQAGVAVPGIVDIRPAGPGATAAAAAAEHGLAVLAGYTIVGTHGRAHVRQARAMRLGSDARSVQPGMETVLDCDLLAMSGGWNPTVHLFSQARGKLRFEEQIGSFVPDLYPPTQAMRCAGACAGRFGLVAVIADGLDAGAKAARAVGGDGPDPVPPAA